MQISVVDQVFQHEVSDIRPGYFQLRCPVSTGKTLPILACTPSVDERSRCMGCLRDVCQEIIQMLDDEGRLTETLSPDDAIDILLVMLSIEQWELLTRECRWSAEKHVNEMKKLLTRSFVK